MTRTVRLLVPTAVSTAEKSAASARPATIRTLAFLHNGEPQYDTLAAALLEALARRRDLTVREYRKPRYGSPAEPALLDAIAGSAQAVLVGLACSRVVHVVECPRQHRARAAQDPCRPALHAGLRGRRGPGGDSAGLAELGARAGSR